MTPRFFAGFFLAASSLASLAQQPGTSPVKIFIMAGQSNTQGHGELSPATTQGTLSHLVENDPAGRYQFLKDGANWAERGDVWIHYQRNVPLGSGVRKGGLTVGYGAASGNTTIGPEVGFGHVLGDVNDNQILLIKTCWGGKSLGVDFLPPSSENYPTPVAEGDKGFFYQKILEIVDDVTSNLAANFPGYNGQGYEIAGFAWHQGWNDRVDAVNSASYQTNMANFINDIRDDLAVPDLPFVIATTGMDGRMDYGYTTVEKAQLKMADTATYPAFAGNVAVVDARDIYEGLDFWQPVSASPADQGFHWNRNARTYLHIGLAMGDAMSLLATGRTPYRPRASGGPGGVTLTWKNGTEVPNSVRVLRNGIEIAAAAPAVPASFTDASAPLGVNQYELQFTMPVSPAAPLSFSHNAGVTDLEAHRRRNGMRLTWRNNLGYPALQVRRNGTLIAASLSGTATSFVDPSPPAGPVTYSVEPSSTGSTPAEVQVTVSAAPGDNALIYEPFDMTAASPLTNQIGGIGLDGNWLADTNVQVSAGSLTFGTLPTFGNRITRTSANGSATIVIGDVLHDAGLMDHGAELWFSFLAPNPDNINVSPTLVLGNENLNNNTSLGQSGSAIGARLHQGKTVQGLVFNGGGVAATSATQATLGTAELALIVGRIQWGATPAAPDTISIYTPGTNLVLDTPQSTSAVIDQSNFRVLSMWGNGTAPTIDEIRFGATYDDVIGQGVDTSGDLTPPAPSTMSFDVPPTAVTDSVITMTATLATDANGVQYRFHNTTLDTFSPWQDSPTFTDTGLAANTPYTYTVQARDKSVNENLNTVSPAAAATTLPPDTTPPPVPGFASAPAGVSATEITMTATRVTDPEGGVVQYRFHNTTLATSSGWQTGTTYIATGLTPDTSYLFTVQARDSAAVPNESAASAPQSGTTLGASNGTWAFDADGSWGDSTKWTGNVVASGSGATAFFTPNITANRTVSLDAPYTVGNITFTDTTTSSNDLTLAGATVLALDVISGTPVIDVTQSGRSLTISNVVTGTKGLQKSGAGRLALGGSNTYSGTTTVAGGILDLGAASLTGFGGGTGRNISVSAGAAVRRNTLDNAFLNRLVETTAEITVMSGATGNNLDFSSSTGANLPNAFFGNWAGNGAKMEYTGTLTPAADHYRLGSPTSNGLLGIRGTLTGTQGLIVGGSRVNLVAANTFSGDTVIRSGAKLTIGHNLALQNSALDVGATGGTFALAAGSNGGRITGETAAASPTFGGLKGSRALLTVFTNSGGNNETNLASTAITGFTLNPGTGKTGTYSGAIANFAPASTLTKTGAGTQTLSGTNSYTGATHVNQGTLALVGGSQASPITVATGASLGFTLGSPTTSTSSLNLTNGTVKITGTVNNASDYLLMTASTITGTPVLHTPIPNYELQKTAGNTQLKLVYVAPASPYNTWKTTNAPTGTPEDDFDGDGVSNALEFVLGGDKDTRDLAKLPTVATDGTDMLFTFRRDQDSIHPSTAVTIEVGTNLATLDSATYPVPDSAVSSNPGVTVVKNSPAAGTDTVTLRLPLASAPRKFASLKVLVTP
jgi:autotransporter-associated beta strand protein